MSWSGENYVSEYADPHDFVYETSGDLFHLDEFEGRESIGKFRVYYVDVERAMNEREPIYYVLDDHSAEVAEYFEPIFESEGYDFNENLLETVGHEVTGYNILILGAPCSLSGQVPLIVRTRFNSRLNREANIRDYHSG